MEVSQTVNKDEHVYFLPLSRNKGKISLVPTLPSCTIGAGVCAAVVDVFYSII